MPRKRRFYRFPGNFWKTRNKKEITHQLANNNVQPIWNVYHAYSIACSEVLGMTNKNQLKITHVPKSTF